MFVCCCVCIVVIWSCEFVLCVFAFPLFHARLFVLSVIPQFVCLCLPQILYISRNLFICHAPDNVNFRCLKYKLSHLFIRNFAVDKFWLSNNQAIGSRLIVDFEMGDSKLFDSIKLNFDGTKYPTDI